MGNLCCPATDGMDEPTGIGARIKVNEMLKHGDADEDLAPVSFEGKNPYEKLELSLPFCRTHMKSFVRRVRQAETEHENDGFVTIELLRKHFNTPAWKPLHDDNSNLCKILASEAFKCEEKPHSPEEIYADYLVTYGIMLCFGKKTEKAEEFYNVLQEGGQEAHTFITANDKDLHPHFRKMCHLTTIHLF